MHFPGETQSEYEFMGQKLDELLIRIRDKWKNLWWLPDFCARLYRLVFDEGLWLLEAFDELWRQSNGQIYLTPFYSDLVSGIDGDIHTEQNSIIFFRNLIATLNSIKNTHL